MSEFKVGEPVRVAGLNTPVMRILAPNAGPMTGPGTNSYLIGDHELALVDPGPADNQHLEALVKAVADRPLRWILVSHTHADHSPGATPIAELFGAELVGVQPPDNGHHDRSFSPARTYRDGEVLAGEEFSVELIHTPGHVSNHFCYLLREEGVLFTGDHILQGTTSVILPPDGNMSDYMRSLQRLRAKKLQYLAPGHGHVMSDPAAAIDELLKHRMARENKIVKFMPVGDAIDTESLTRRVYDDVAPHLLPWARMTLEAHLIKLEEESRVVRREDSWLLVDESGQSDNSTV